MLIGLGLQYQTNEKSPFVYLGAVLLVPIVFINLYFWVDKMMNLLKVVLLMRSRANTEKHRIIDLVYGYLIWTPTEMILFPETPHSIALENASVRSVFAGSNETVKYPTNVGDESLVSPVYTGEWLVIETEEPNEGAGLLIDDISFKNPEELLDACKTGKWHSSSRYGWVEALLKQIAFLLLWTTVLLLFGLMIWKYHIGAIEFPSFAMFLVIFCGPHYQRLRLWKRSYHLLEMELVSFIAKDEKPVIHPYTTNPTSIGHDEFLGVDHELRTIRFNQTEIHDTKVKGKSLVLKIGDQEFRFENSSPETVNTARTRLMSR